MKVFVKILNKIEFIHCFLFHTALYNTGNGDGKTFHGRYM